MHLEVQKMEHFTLVIHGLEFSRSCTITISKGLSSQSSIRACFNPFPMSKTLTKLIAKTHSYCIASNVRMNSIPFARLSIIPGNIPTITNILFSHHFTELPLQNRIY